MSQEEVIKVLEKESEPLSVGEIAIILNCCASKISKELNKLIKYKEVKYKEVNKNIAMEKYKCKRRMRIYYV